MFYILLFCSLLLLEYSTFYLNPDTSIQLHTLKNFTSGHGIALTSLDVNNIVVYKPCSLWPAGLVIFMTPIYLLTGSAVTSLLILKFTSYFFFILFLSRLFTYLKLKDFQKKFILVFFIISVAPFVMFNVSDTLATTICLWGFYFYLQYLDDDSKKNLVIGIGLLGLSFFVKTSFLPFLVFPALAYILKMKSGIFRTLKQFTLIIVLTIFTAVGFYFLNKSLVGPAQLVSTFDALHGNPHWSQLSRMDGFLFTFGIYEWVFQNLIKNLFAIKFDFNWLSLVVTIYFYYVLVKYFFRKDKTPCNSHFNNSINISLSASALIIGFLSLLTINNPGQTWVKPYWTFVEETRYYGPVIIIGLINILILFTIKKKGILLHILVPLMMVFNLYAYRATIQMGFWGDNYKTYALTKQNVSKYLTEESNSKKDVVVYYDIDTKNSTYYFYLQAIGTILIENKNEQNIQNPVMNSLRLVKESEKRFNLIKVN